MQSSPMLAITHGQTGEKSEGIDGPRSCKENGNIKP
jgi:hypothetical protein